MSRKVKNPPWGMRGFGRTYSGTPPTSGWRSLGYDRVVPIRDAAKRRVYGARQAFLRNIGVAIVQFETSKGLTPFGKQIAVYAHSQVTNDPRNTGLPAVTMFLDADAAEQLAAMLMGAVMEFSKEEE